MDPNNDRRRIDRDSDQSGNDEALEDENVIDVSDGSQSMRDESEGEDLHGDNMMDDYRAIPELDQYDQRDIDDQEYSQMDIEDQRQAEQEMISRQQQQNRDRRIPMALYEDQYEDYEDELRRELMKQQRLREINLEQMGLEEDQEYQDGFKLDDEEEEYEKFIDAEEEKGDRKKWIKEEKTIRWIRKRFKQFLFFYNNQFYRHKINDMAQNNYQSIEIDYDDMKTFQATLALWIQEEPGIILEYLNQIGYRVVLQMYPNYHQIHSEVYVKIKGTGLQKENIRDLRYSHLTKLIKIQGVVTRRSQVFSQLKSIYYTCLKCGDKKGPVYISVQQERSNTNLQMGQCYVCQSKGPFEIDQQKTLYRNYQKLHVQEPPSEVPAGKVPRHKDIICTGDNIDLARPGDLVEILGIYTLRYDYNLNVKHSFPIFSTTIESNSIKRMNDIQTEELSYHDIQQIKQLSKKANIAQMIVSSIAPTIFGHKHTKTALAMAMFGGIAKDLQSKHKIRGDINVLMLGDPGCGKSQLLKYVEHTFPRSVFTTGKGATGVGLTASVMKDPSTREWTLEGGALVLADQGICLIDEFDKMTENDRTSIHEAMEQQSISISKAGIVATLQARCSVIAAANPIKGRYDSQLNFTDNVDLTDPILSRFDVLSVVKDQVNQDTDYDMASFVINSHIKNHPLFINYQYHMKEEEKEYYEEDYLQMKSAFLDQKQTDQSHIIPQDLLRKYIIHARKEIRPKLQGIDKQKLINFYQELRQEANRTNGLHIATRHIESMVRMAEAHARMHLRNVVIDDDVDKAISVMMESFIQTQKFSLARTIQKKFIHYLRYQDDYMEVLINQLNKLCQEQLNYMQLQRQNHVQDIFILKTKLVYDAKNLNIAEKYVDDFIQTDLFKTKYELQVGMNQQIIRRKVL